MCIRDSFKVGAHLVKHHNAHAGRTGVGPPAQAVGLAQRLQDLVGHDFGMRGSGVVVEAQCVKHHHELVTPQVGHGVIVAHTGGQTPGHLAQQVVAKTRSQGFIKLSEICLLYTSRCV